MNNQGYLFDSHALLAFFQNEPGADIVRNILEDILQQRNPGYICIINLGEVLYMTKRRFGDEKKIEILARLHQLGIRILSIPDRWVYQAAEIKAQYPISYADCFALVSAREKAAKLVTGDPEFRLVSDMADIVWIR